MPARQTTIRTWMIAILVMGLVMGGMLLGEKTAPRDFPVIFRILCFEAMIAVPLAILILLAVVRDRP